MVNPSNRVPLSAECEGCQQPIVYHWLIYSTDTLGFWRRVIEESSYIEGTKPDCHYISRVERVVTMSNEQSAIGCHFQKC